MILISAFLVILYDYWFRGISEVFLGILQGLMDRWLSFYCIMLKFKYQFMNLTSDIVRMEIRSEILWKPFKEMLSFELLVYSSFGWKFLVSRLDYSWIYGEKSIANSILSISNLVYSICWELKGSIKFVSIVNHKMHFLP